MWTVYDVFPDMKSHKLINRSDDNISLCLSRQALLVGGRS